MHAASDARIRQALALPDESQAGLQALPVALLSSALPRRYPGCDAILRPENAAGRPRRLSVSSTVLTEFFSILGIRWFGRRKSFYPVDLTNRKTRLAVAPGLLHADYDRHTTDLSRRKETGC